MLESQSHDPKGIELTKSGIESQLVGTLLKDASIGQIDAQTTSWRSLIADKILFGHSGQLTILARTFFGLNQVCQMYKKRLWHFGFEMG